MPSVTRVKVRQKHIDEGSKGNGNNCPIALAIQDATGVEMFVGSSVYYPPKVYDENIVMDNTPEITDFINDFDSDSPVQPFEFNLPWVKS